MAGNSVRNYPESLLQWIWGNLQFDCTKLKTAQGLDLSIVNPGRLNTASGPDFKDAELIIDGIRWHGHVEIHIRANDWDQHGHQDDPAYGGVILHVVLNNPHHSVQTTAGTVPHTLGLEPYLQSSLAKLLKVRHSSTLPCSGTVTYLSQQAFERQIQKVHQEYFEYKLDELLSLYNPHLPPGRAWVQCLTGQIYRTLGIPGNITAMEELHSRISGFDQTRYTEIEEWVETVLRAAFLQTPFIDWKSDGMRPAGKPKRRVSQAAALQFSIEKTSLQQFITMGLSSWPTLIQAVPKPFLPGKERSDTVKHTVFLPSIYLLGRLFHDRKLMSHSYELWKSGMPHLPAEISKPFLEAGLRISRTTPQGGLVHQYKRYCLQRRCHLCKVFYTAIRS
ncbi:MAG: DUF2851 family protein [Balneolaceae bacterium]|nr:DUF2851 family protein [Balneolaceae bacterium]